MSRRKVTPRRAASKSAVNVTQRRLQGEAVALRLMAKELAAVAARVNVIWQSLQRAQGR